MSISAKLLRMCFTESNFKFNLDSSGATTIQVKTESKIFPPTGSKDNTALLKMRIIIESIDTDDIKIEAMTNSIFEFSEIPSDYDKVSTDLCIPKAHDKALSKIDDILENMGFSRINLRRPEEN